MKFEIVLATTGLATLASVTLASILLDGAAAAFSQSAAPRHPLWGQTTTPSTTLILAKPTRKGNKKTKNDSSKPKSGTGFGTSSSSGSSSGSDVSHKLRSVSGQHTGSGSKILRKAANLFDLIRKEHGNDACNDVYVRSPLNSPTTYWYVGKVAAAPGQATGRDACLAQRRIILEYSKTQLRPQNMGGKVFAPHLELWLAPGDSEMDVVTNKVTLEKVVGNAADLSDDFNVNAVGYNPEIYVGDELKSGGLRVERDEEGRPTKPVFEVNESA